MILGTLGHLGVQGDNLAIGFFAGGASISRYRLYIGAAPSDRLLELVAVLGRLQPSTVFGRLLGILAALGRARSSIMQT